MKRVICIGLILIIFSCSTESSNEYSEANNPKNLNKEISKIPNSIALDTTSLFDSSLNVELFISIPMSGVDKIDEYVDSNVQIHKINFEQILEDIIKEDGGILCSANSDFQFEPLTIYKDSLIYSIQFLHSVYQCGAPHGKTMFNSINFDMRTMKPIDFNNYFELSTGKDPLELCNLLTETLNLPGINISSIYNFDFNIQSNDTISFNFDDYELGGYAVGIRQIKLSRKMISKYVKSKYR